MSDNSFKIVARLDVPKSAKLIKEDIPKIENQLKSDRINITAAINIKESKRLIQSQLNTISNGIDSPKINLNVSIDKKAVNTANNIGASIKEVGNNASHAEKEVNKLASAFAKLDTTDVKQTRFNVAFNTDGQMDLEQTLANAEKLFSKYGDLTFNWSKDDSGEVNRITTIITAANGEVQKLNFNLDKTNELFEFKSSSGSNSGIKKLVNDIEVAQKKYGILLDNIKSDYQDPNTSKPIRSNGNLSKLDEQYRNVELAIKSLANADSITFAQMQADVDNEISKLNNLIKQFRNAEYAATSLRTKDIDTIKINQKNDLDKFINQISGSKVPLDVMTQDISELKTSLDSVGDSKALTEFLNQFDNVKSKFGSLKTLYQSIGIHEKDLNKLTNALKKQGLYTDETKQSIREMFYSLNSVKDTNGLIEWTNKYKGVIAELNSSLNKARISSNNFQDSLSKTNGAEKFTQKVELLESRIKAYMQTNTKAAKIHNSTFDNMLTELSNPNINEDAYNRIFKQFQQLRLEINAAGKAGKGFFEKLSDQAKKFSSWMTLTGVITSAWHGINQMVTNVIELDSAMTNLKKVTNETDSTYARFLKSSFKEAQNLHSKVNDLIEQTSTWAKLGYSLQDAESLAKISMIYSKVGEVDNVTAVSDLVTVMKAFNIESGKSISIVDAFNELGEISPLYTVMYIRQSSYIS